MKRVILALLALGLAGCGTPGGTTPTGPLVATPVTGPRILVAGQSNAYFLVPFLPEAIDFSNIDGSVDYWLSNREFAEAARTAQLLALVWSQGGRDIAMSTAEYASKLRSVIQIARVSNATLPVRIVEIPDRPERAHIREAQRQVAEDQGVQLIPTADLPFDVDGNHFTTQGYQTIRERIYRSLGR